MEGSSLANSRWSPKFLHVKSLKSHSYALGIRTNPFTINSTVIYLSDDLLQIEEFRLQHYGAIKINLYVMLNFCFKILCYALLKTSKTSKNIYVVLNSIHLRSLMVGWLCRLLYRCWFMNHSTGQMFSKVYKLMCSCWRWMMEWTLLAFLPLFIWFGQTPSHLMIGRIIVNICINVNISSRVPADCYFLFNCTGV